MCSGYCVCETPYSWYTSVLRLLQVLSQLSDELVILLQQGTRLKAWSPFCVPKQYWY